MASTLNYVCNASSMSSNSFITNIGCLINAWDDYSFAFLWSVFEFKATCITCSFNFLISCELAALHDVSRGVHAGV